MKTLAYFASILAAQLSTARPVAAAQDLGCYFSDELNATKLSSLAFWNRLNRYLVEPLPEMDGDARQMLKSFLREPKSDRVVCLRGTAHLQLYIFEVESFDLKPVDEVSLDNISGNHRICSRQFKWDPARARLCESTP